MKTNIGLYWVTEIPFQAIQAYLKLGEAISLLDPLGCNQLICKGIYYVKMSNLDNGRNSYLLRDVELQNIYISEWKFYSDIGIEITRIEIQ